MANDLLDLEVAYAKADEQALIKLQLPSGTTARQVIENSGILRQFNEIDLANNAVGIFGKLIDLDKTVLQHGDRLEIYRPLIADPKEQRQRRAAAGKVMKKRV